MKNYTIGIILNNTTDRVVLIKKKRPDWQAGRLNFPGGHIEKGESAVTCISREIKEECDLDIPEKDWTSIGKIVNYDEPYEVHIFAVKLDTFSAPIKTITDEEVSWEDALNLPARAISNLAWLVPFARNYFVQGNRDNLFFGMFEYVNK